MKDAFREVKQSIHFKRKSALDFPAHLHDDIELVYLKKGRGTAYCAGKKYDLEENSFFLVFPNQVHHYSGCAEGEYIILIIKPSELLGYASVFEGNTPVSALWHFEEKGDDNTVYLLETALAEFQRDGHSTVIRAYLTAFFGKLLTNYPIEASPMTHDTVSRILRYCAAHYKEDITVGRAAADLHLSRSSVSHMFQARLSMNFCDYINSLRLNDAVHLLKDKRYSITEVSGLCGFSTIRTFNRAFRKRYGTTPTAYRKSCAKEQQRSE